MMFDTLRGKKILVTGSSSGIGAEIAHVLAKYGADIGIHCRKNTDGARKVISEIENFGIQTKIYQGDLTDSSFVESLVNQFCEDFGAIDVLVNNAGSVINPKPYSVLTIEDWEQNYLLNAIAPFLLMRSAFGIMKKTHDGKIINISSISVKYGGNKTSLPYSAAKASLELVTKSFAKYGAKYNILVNAIRPGFIDTAAHQKMGRTPEEIKERIKLIPLKNSGKPIDIANMVAFLASSGGDFITGEIFGVTGGD